MNDNHAPQQYKVLENGKSCHGGDLQWSLPTLNADGTYTPGQWHEVEGDIEVCANGLHLTTQPWGKWMTWTATVYEAEGAGSSDADGDKTAFQRARLLRPAPVPEWWTNVHTFVDSLKDVKFFQPDGKPEPEWKLFTAPTWAAAWAAARTAAWDAAARDAAAAAWAAARDAAAAAWAAAGAAAAAARAAAGDAAGDAAWDAAGDAARAAARTAAWDAAARDAAGAAARAAARDAALWARMIITADLDVAPEHRAHAQARWLATAKGYGVICDVGGVLYVYSAESEAE